MPEAIMELRHELHSRGASLHADLSGALLEVTRLVATSHAGVLVRVMALEGPKNDPDHKRRDLVMLELVAERAQVNGGGKERFGLTEREWEVRSLSSKASRTRRLEMRSALRSQLSKPMSNILWGK